MHPEEEISAKRNVKGERSYCILLLRTRLIGIFSKDEKGRTADEYTGNLSKHKIEERGKR